jgi:peptidoglycan/xylan/chitin deacetylase (PgdA/CDA1 family)
MKLKLVLIAAVSFLISLVAIGALSASTNIFTRIISGPNDSVYFGSTFDSTTTNTFLGKVDGTVSTYHFFLIDNITITQGSTITNVSLDLTALGAGGDTVRVRIRAQDVANATAPTSGEEFTSKQAQLTAEYVDWEPPAGNWGDIMTTPDLKSIIQGIVNKDDWESGNSILLFIGDNSSDDWSSRQYATGDFPGGEPKPTFTIEYEVINLAPTANNDNYSTNSKILLHVLENDTDPENDDLVITDVSAPSNGTTSIESNKILYTPTSGFTGTDTFIYTITDGNGNTDTASVTINVVPNPIIYSYTFNIDRQNVPTLYFNYLTFIASMGEVESVSAKLNGDSLAILYDSESGEASFTTIQAGEVELLVQNPVDLNSISVQKSALKDGKKFAWSHGMDDNVFLSPQINLMSAKNWQATFFLIAKDVHDTREEDWILDKPQLIPLFEQGWGIGNHTWSQNCFGEGTPTDEEVRAEILDGYNRLRSIADESSIPTRRLLAFAAPCFASVFDNYIEEMRVAGETEVLFNESQGSGLMIVDSGTSDYVADAKTATAVSSETVKIGRNTDIDGNVAIATGILDWMNTHSHASRHFWLNTLTHGNNEANMEVFIDHAYNTYGPGGTNVLWVAPSDEIYSYLMVRDTTILSEGQWALIQDGSGQQPPAEESQPAPITLSSISGPSSDDQTCKDEMPGLKAPWLYGAIANTSNSVLLYFTPGDNPIDKYVLEYGTQSGIYKYGVQDLGVNSPEQMTFLVSSLAPYTTYYFRIRSGNGCAVGPWSNEITTRTKNLLATKQLEITSSQLRLQSNDYGGQKVVSTEKESQIEHDLDFYEVLIVVNDENNQPVEGATVTIFSTPQTRITDENGLARFESVELGSHTVRISYKGYEGEQSLYLSGSEPTIELAVEIKRRQLLFSNEVIWIMLGLVGLISVGFYISYRKKSHTLLSKNLLSKHG